MFDWFRRLHEWATRNPVARINDPILGELVISDLSWECSVPSRVGPIILRVGGRYEPDPTLIETARRTFSRIDDFVDHVTHFLKTEAQNKAWSQFVDEINSLTIRDINFWWPKKPKAGMVFFAAPDECKLWHCDVNDDRCFGLTFDS